MQIVTFTNTYTQLTPVERTFVDKIVRTVCDQARRERVLPLTVLERGIDPRRTGADGAELLRRPMVRAAIHETVREIGAATSITIETVMMELWSIIHSNLDDVMSREESGWIDWQLHKASRDQMRAFSSMQIETFPDGRKKIRASYWDKLDAIKLWFEMLEKLPVNHPFRTLEVKRTGQSTTLPAEITESDAAEQWSRRLQEMMST